MPAVFRIRIRDPVSGAFLTPGSGIRMGKKSGSVSGMNNLDHISESLETLFWVKILKFFDAIQDPGWKKNLDPGSEMEKIRIRYKRPGSATLHARYSTEF
jgi:hypothetical protein